MTNLNGEKLPTRVVEEAMQIIRTQGPTPDSPAERKPDGGIALCAAAALASAGLRLEGSAERRQRFEEELLILKSTDPIREVFKELGWSVEVCNKAVIASDSFARSVRRESVLEYFRRLPNF